MYEDTFFLVFPEFFLTLLGCFVLLFDLCNKNKEYIYYIIQISLFSLCIYLLFLFDIKDINILNNSYCINYLTTFFKFFIILSMILIFSYSRKYLKFLNLYNGEYFSLCLFSVLGMIVLISSNNFLVLYLGLELLALPLYVLISMSKKTYNNSQEASIKYFIMGSVSTGLLLFGISLIYGLTNSIYFVDIFDIIFRDSLYNNIIMQLGIIFIIIGFGFKFGVVPFHMWVPDVYQGAPIPITLLIGTIPKVAAFCILYRVFIGVFDLFVFEWGQIFIYLGILSLFVGNITAIVQTNIKRMLGYSAIAHIGFIFFGLATGSKYGHVSAFFYLFVYILMALAAFGIIIALSRKGYEAEQIDSFKGLSSKSPILALFMSIVIFSMAGLPPFAGFYAKMLIIKDLLYLEYYFIVFLAILLSVIGLFYYLRVIKVIFFDNVTVYNNEKGISSDGLFLLSINSFLVLFFGIYPEILFNVCIKLVN